MECINEGFARKQEPFQYCFIIYITVRVDTSSLVQLLEREVF